MKRPTEDAIVISLAWGEGEAGSVVAMGRVRPGGRFSIGEGAGCDAVVPFEATGQCASTVVSWDGAPRVHPPRFAAVWVDHEEVASGPVAIRPGQIVELVLGGFTLRVERATSEAWAEPAHREPALSLLGGIAIAAFGQLALFGTLAFYLPPSATADREISREEIVALRIRLDDPVAAKASPAASLAAASDVAGKVKDPRPADRQPERASSGAPRTWGSPVAATQGAPAPVDDRTVDDRTVAANFGMVALVRALHFDPAEPNAYKDALASLDAHAAQTMAMFGDPPIEQTGIGGLVLSGVGEGGGGKGGTGIEVTNEIVSLSNELAREQALSANCHGDECPAHLARAGEPHMRWHGDVAILGDIDDAAVRRIVHASDGRMQACAGARWRQHATHAETILVVAEIDEGGAVSVARHSGGTVADEATVACIVKTFYALQFPPNHGGPVKIRYPVLLTPGD